MPTPVLPRTAPSRAAAPLGSAPLVSASVSASTAGWYQSPGRSQTDSAVAARHASRSSAAECRLMSVVVTPDETDRARDS